MPLSANISNIARSSLHDGPGIRTVVYFKGCGLRCLWCHNPETISASNEILYAPIKCVRCGRCIDICPEHHIITDGDMVFLRDDCLKCGRCSESCPTGALSNSAKQMTIDEVMEELVKDKHYYDQNGGVTLSGGECLLQADFCAALLMECKKQNIHTAIETALYVPWDQMEKVLPLCDLFFCDFKIPDPEKHKRYTGKDNFLVLDNLQRLAEKAPGKVIIRIPLIPGVNDSQDDITGFAEKFSPFIPALKGVEVLRYNTLAKTKYSMSGKVYTDFGQPQSDEILLKYCSRLQQALLSETIVYTAL